MVISNTPGQELPSDWGPRGMNSSSVHASELELGGTEPSTTKIPSLSRTPEVGDSEPYMLKHLPFTLTLGLRYNSSHNKSLCGRGLERRQEHLIPSRRRCQQGPTRALPATYRQPLIVRTLCSFWTGRVRMLGSILRAIAHSQIGNLFGEEEAHSGTHCSNAAHSYRKTLHLLRWPALTRFSVLPRVELASGVLHPQACC